MAGIFISYRRDDASGHAGRLFDRLAARFGRDRVFMDVTDIAPGEDFAHAIETSVGGSEVLLAMMGPQWLGAVNERGVRRIDEPTDFVRQEIAAGLQRQVRVIPVLVRGARMPREDELPKPLKPLARRQAVELTDARWESDVALFEQALAERVAGPAGTPRVDERRAFGKRSIVAAIAIALLIGGAAYVWRARSGDGHEAAMPANPPKSLADPDRSEITPGRLKVATAHRALSLPSGARFKLAGQQFEILGLRTEPAGNQDLLTIRLRMTNNGPYADTFTNVAAVLEMGDESIPAAAPVFELIPGYAAKEGELQFPLAGPTQDATLVLRYANQEETRIPLSIKEGKPFSASATVDAFGRPKRGPLVDAVKSLPLALDLPARHAAQLGYATLSLRSLRLDRYNAERASLEVEVQAKASPEARGGINFWSDNVRLYVDGVPRAPENLVNEVVAGGTARTATFEFLLSDAPERLEVAFRAGGTESDRWPIAIPGVK